jgi:DNA-binding response OmpR family regulator
MKHIAVVEDEALMREELADMLRRAGYAVTEVTDFADVTGQLLALAPDLVLLDLNLPEVSGFQICRDLKRRSALPVLVLTSRDQLRDEVHALELGADEYLTKPYRKERLLARIGNVLKRYEGRPNLLEGADFLLDRQTYTLYIHNQSVVLPPNQGKLLETLADRHERRAEPRALGHDGVHRRECAAGQPHAAEKDDGVPRHVPAARVRARRRLPAGGGA